MPHRAIAHPPSTRLPSGALLSWGEIAFRLDAGVEAGAKYYGSALQEVDGAWRAEGVAGLDVVPTARALATLTVPHLAPGLARALHTAANARLPMGVFQVGRSWDGAWMGRLKTYRMRNSWAAGGYDHARFLASLAPAKPWMGALDTERVEGWGAVWPDSSPSEIYGFDTLGHTAPGRLAQAMASIGAVPISVSLDRDGVVSWYHAAPGHDAFDAAQATAEAAGVALHPDARARLQRLLDEGWAWGESIHQIHPERATHATDEAPQDVASHRKGQGAIVPIAYLTTPTVAGLPFRA